MEKRLNSGHIRAIHNAKPFKSFNCARWKRGYNNDLIFVSERFANMCGKQSWTCKPGIVVAHPTPCRRRVNLQKADWDGYSTCLNKLIEDVEPIPEKKLWWVRG